ncbi:MAG: 16S rRNA (guanine(966)-N(2))-methyltransferase RsmD [Clostridia bacterium]|nr:16S rRNA (guanine(966)-N(2))-methyltransferase RsmD [Clostridia bacterium]
MRIISGLKRGLKLKSLEGSDTRPTLDSVKEAIFSMLFDSVNDAAILDLFAGSGALGLEALSRGAKKAVFVDSNPKACNIVRANIESAGFEEKASVIKKDAIEFLTEAGKKGEKFSLIFLDPPYALALLDEVLDLISQSGILTENGLIVCEFDNGTKPNIKSFNLLKDKRYGRVCVNILEASK